MKKQELIDRLNAIDCDDVVIFDWRKMAFNADGEPSTVGIHDDFTVEIETEESGATIPFIALSFDNDDYTNDADVERGSLLYSVIEKEVKEDIKFDLCDND